MHYGSCITGHYAVEVLMCGELKAYCYFGKRGMLVSCEH